MDLLQFVSSLFHIVQIASVTGRQARRRTSGSAQNSNLHLCFERTMSEYSIYLGDGDDLRIDAVRTSSPAPRRCTDVCVRLKKIDPLLSPALLRSEVPLSDRAIQVIKSARAEVADVLSGKSDKLVVIVGPCSIHNPEEAREYAALLKVAAQSLPELVIIMRAYFEKVSDVSRPVPSSQGFLGKLDADGYSSTRRQPRTTVGWKGLINDPDIDGSFAINKGLRLARSLLADITDSGVPVGCELLDTISPQFLSDCISWGAIGARTTGLSFLCLSFRSISYFISTQNPNFIVSSLRESLSQSVRHHTMLGRKNAEKCN